MGGAKHKQNAPRLINIFDIPNVYDDIAGGDGTAFFAGDFGLV